MISPDQCRAARILLRWTASDLAGHAKIGIATIKRFEGLQPVHETTLVAIRDALEEGGVVLVAEGEASLAGGPGVRTK